MLRAFAALPNAYVVRAHGGIIAVLKRTGERKFLGVRPKAYIAIE